MRAAGARNITVNTYRQSRFALVGVLALSSATFLPGAVRAQMDMNLMMYWGDATVIRWHVVGDYEGEEMILNVSTLGYAPVRDHVEITFEYTNEGNGGLLGEPLFVDSPTEMGELRNGEPSCRTPTVSGRYEHATIESIEDGLGGQLAMTVRTDYPEGKVAGFCTGGDQASPARSSTDRVDLSVPGIMLLAMGNEAASPELQVAPDKKSLIVKRDGWTYVYTPTKVK